MMNLWKTWEGEKLDADKDLENRGSYVFHREFVGENSLIDRALQSARKTVPLALGNIPKKFAELRSFKAANWQDFFYRYTA